MVRCAQASEASPHEVLLGELFFTDPIELPKLVELRMDDIDETFLKFVEDKADGTPDLEEKQTLWTFLEALKDLLSRMSEKGISKEAKSMNPEETYDALLNEMVNASDGVRMAVTRLYNRIDNRFLEHLSSKIDASTGKEQESLVELKDMIIETMSARMTKATEVMKTVFQAGPPEEMERKLVELYRMGDVDEAFLLLLKGNIDQARKAGAEPAVQVLSRLRSRAMELGDANAEPEVVLVRKLLRTEDRAQRKAFLIDALLPKGKVVLEDGRSTSSGSKVDGAKVVQTLKRLIEDFGNIDAAFVKKVTGLATECEEAAREIFGLEGKDAKELQDEAFHKRSVSVFDLERVEMEAEMKGEKAPWEDSRLKGFEDGRKTI